jgi:hypothetical protein
MSSGERIRGRFVLKKIHERAPKQMLIAHEVTVEIETTARPALVAQWLCLGLLARVPRRSTAAYSTAFRKPTSDQDSTTAKAAVASPS